MATVSNAGEASDRSTARAWYVLVVLFLIYVCSTADRHILSILAQDIKQDLHLSDTQIGLLTGPAIAVLYGIMSVPVAHLADRFHRVRLLALCLALWSVFTGLGSLATNAFTLALSRIGVSAAEGGGMPASASLLADYFPPEKRPLALTIYSISAMVGIFLSFTIGGYLAASHGWRVALIAAALPGFALCALLLITVREPGRGATDTASERASDSGKMPLRQSLVRIFGDPLFRTVLIASSLTSFASAGALAWGPTLAMRRFAADAAQVGGRLGIGIAILGGIAMLVAGLLADRVQARHGRAATFRIIAVAQLAGVPVLAFTLLIDSLTGSLILLGLFYGIMHLYVAVYWNAASMMPASIRATTSAVGVLTLIVVGSGLAPPVVGGLSDLLTPALGASGLPWAMSILAVAVAASSLIFLRAATLCKTT